MLLRIAYCDDEPENGRKIKEYVTQLTIQTEEEIELEYFVSGMVLLEKIEKEPDYYDVILLDMEMPQINGIELAEKIRKITAGDVIITFLTSYPEYMQQSFGVQAFQYLLKPVSYDKFKTEIIRTLDYIRNDERSILVVDNDIGYETVLRLKNIVSIEKQKGNAVMEITLLKNEMSAKGNISDYETVLLENNFIRVSRNCIVNMRYIHTFFNREIRMTTGKQVEMSRRKVTDVKERFTKYLVLGGK